MIKLTTSIIEMTKNTPVLIPVRGMKNGKKFHVLGYTLVDSWMLPAIAKSHWNYSGKIKKYVYGKDYLHRVIMTEAGVDIDGLDVDHRNNCRIDNCLRNLRPATRRQNLANYLGDNRKKKQHSKYAGVTKMTKKYQTHSGEKTFTCWIAQTPFCADTKTSSHKTELSAALNYDLRKIEEFGDFAKTNFDKDKNIK